MAKAIKAQVKLQIPAGAATPAPPVGTALGPHGINLQEFCARFNEATRDKAGDIIPTIVTIYEDRSFSLVYKSSPAAELLKKAAGVEKGSGEPHKSKVGKVTQAQVREIAEKKMADLSAHDPSAAAKIIEGTARSMGLDVIE
ncbi:50S ribosomal protein L11 [Candidatus Parcubacteria bacterium]|nr:50S ribosomal protein L11 [Candidatus Parcubacteria bacterium]